MGNADEVGTSYDTCINENAAKFVRQVNNCTLPWLYEYDPAAIKNVCDDNATAFYAIYVYIGNGNATFMSVQPFFAGRNSIRSAWPMWQAESALVDKHCHHGRKKVTHAIKFLIDFPQRCQILGNWWKSGLDLEGQFHFGGSNFSLQLHFPW